MRDFAAMIRGDALEAADGDGFRVTFLIGQSSAAAGRLAGAIASAAEDRREDVGFPVQHVGGREFALRDEANVFRDVGVRGAGPLAINDLVKILGTTANVAGLHGSSYCTTYRLVASDSTRAPAVLPA